MRVVSLSIVVYSIISVCIQAQQICNNAAALCTRNYDNITYLGAHDSPFVRNSTNDYTGAGDQIYTSLQQLSSGVRLLSAQVHMVTGNDSQVQWRLCHTLCQIYDAGYFVDWLKEIKGWLDDNPNEVVTLLLVNSDDANATTLNSIYQDSGIVPYCYQPSSTTQAVSQWPTLSEMITQNKRLVNFIASLDPADNDVAPYLLDEFTFVFENNYDNVQPTDFSCEPQRPTDLQGNVRVALSTGYMPLMNHFRYDNLTGGIEVPSEENVNVTNAPLGSGVGNLGAAAANCSAYYGRAPTFVLTDFSNVGPAIETIDMMNGVEGQTSGRLALPDTIEESMADPSPSSSGGPASTSTSRSTGSTTRSTATKTASSTAATSSVATSSAASFGYRFQDTISINSGAFQLSMYLSILGLIAGGTLVM